MKKILAIMCVFVLSLSLMACGNNADKDTTGKTETKTEAKNDNAMKDVKWNEWKISVNGCVITLGETKISEAENAGLGKLVQASGTPFNRDILAESVSSGNFENLLNKMYHTSFTFQNESKEDVSVGDCIIDIVNFARKDAEEIKDVTIILPGGFNFEICKISDLIDAYGESTSVFKEDNGTTRYTWSEIDTGSLSIYINDNGNIVEISYYYFA